MLKLSRSSYRQLRVTSDTFTFLRYQHSSAVSTEAASSEASASCSKFKPNTPSAKAIRHLRFKVPLSYERGQQIQEKFSSAAIEFKKMATKIDRKLKELDAQNLTTNDYETQLLGSILDMKQPPLILSFEFKPVITAGRREKHRLTPEKIEKLKSLNYDFHQTNRGGEITFHNPGQLVVYPIFDLKDFDSLTIKCFVSTLEDAIINTLSHYNVLGKKTENTGVWIDDKTKISSIGLSVSRSITSHGLSINVSNEIPRIEDAGSVFCGLENKTQTTLTQVSQNSNITVDDVAVQFVRELSKKLNIDQIEQIDLEDIEID